MRSFIRSIAAIKEIMPQDAFKDLCRSMHFADDWEVDDERWAADYSGVKEEPGEDTANIDESLQSWKMGTTQDGGQ